MSDDINRVPTRVVIRFSRHQSRALSPRFWSPILASFPSPAAPMNARNANVLKEKSSKHIAAITSVTRPSSLRIGDDA
jgi:hypothetical protein